MTISARVRVVNDYVNKVSASFLPVHMQPSRPGGVFFFLNCQKFRDTVPLKPVKPIEHLSAFHVVDIVKVNDGDGFSGSTRHFFLRFLGSLQQQKNKNNNNNIFFSSLPQQPATTTKNNNNNIFFTSV